MLNESSIYYYCIQKEDLQAVSSLLDVKLQPIDHRLESVESRLEKLEPEVSAVKIGQMELRSDIIKLERRISDAYQLAFDAWGRSTENRSWLEQSKMHA